MTATAPGPVPPAPAGDNVSAKVRREQLRAMKRQNNEARRDELRARLRGVNRSWWLVGIAIVAVGVLAVGCRGYVSDQRATTLALAQIANGNTSTATSAPVVVQRIPNPLERMSLTAQAKWLIGVADAKGALQPGRSAQVITQLLESLSGCDTFVGIDSSAAVKVAKQPLPGYVPLVDCATSTTVRATEGTSHVVPMPTDSIPPTTAR